MKQLKLMLTAIVAVFGLFAFRTQPAQGGNFNFRHIFAALCLSATLGIGNVATADDDLGDVPDTGEYGNTIHGAAMKGDPLWVRHFIILNKESVNAPLKNGRTPLHIAARHGRVEAARALIKNGANLEYREQYHKTPLHFAAGFGQVEMIRVLVEAGAVINARDRDSRTPLFWAVDEGKPSAVKVLVELGADAGATDNSGRIPFDYVVKCLTDDKCWDVGDKDKNKNRSAAAAVIIEDWALKFSDNQGAFLLHHAAAKGQTELAIALVKKGADIEKGDGWERTPLHQAALHNKIETARALIEEGANVEARDRWTNLPIQFAIDKNFTEMEELLQAGMDKKEQARREQKEREEQDRWDSLSKAEKIRMCEKDHDYFGGSIKCIYWSLGW